MAQSLIACPVCSSASFSNTSALCLALVNVASKWLRCTMCEEELRGLDKLTIHLLGHLIHSPNFKRCLANNDAFLTRSVSNTQPLNLVKNQNEQTKQNSAHGLTANETLSSAFQTGVGNERPSLKIDDEVMIFFNCDNANEQVLETSNDTKVVRAIDSETPSFSGLPKFTVNFEKTSTGSDKSVNVSNYEKESNMSSENYLERSSRDESFQYFFPVTTEDLNSVDKSISDSVRRKESQLELCDEKEKEIHNSLLNIEQTEVVGNEIKCSVGHTKNKINCKNLFLSPKGERVEGFRCDVCSLVFPDENILCMHRKLIHIELHSGMNEPTSYKCHLCSKSFVMKGSLMVHMRVAHFGGAVVARLVEAKQLETDAVSPDSAQFICSVCNKGFQKEQQLAQHEKLHDGKQCDICFKTFTTKYFLRKHKRLHTGEMPYQCSQCNKSFTFQQSYHKHLLYHSDDKPYTCNDCGRSFKELSTLHNHQRIHTGEKPFSCETCGKCFRQRVSYLVHRRIHTGVMPYRCQDCGKTFRYKVSERTHKCCTSTINGGSDVSNSPLSEGKREGLNTFAKENSEEGNDNEREEKISNGVSKHVPARPPMEAESESYPEAASIAPPMEAESQSYPEVASIVPPMEAESESYPEPADFFSLVMSPSDRLQNLSLASDTVEAMSPINHGSINSEDLKQLLYDVADYS